MGSKNSKCRSRDSLRTRFDLTLHFVRLWFLCSICMPNLEFVALTVLQILKGSPNSENRSRDSFTTPFDQLCICFSYLSLSICIPNLKFLVSTVSVIWIKSPQILKVGHVIISRHSGVTRGIAQGDTIQRWHPNKIIFFLWWSLEKNTG